MAKAHSNAYNTIPYIYHEAGFEIEKKYLSVRSEEKALALAKRYGFARGIAGYEEALEDDGVQVIDICTDDCSHKEIALLALKKGKHVLCEKPLATTAKDALELCAAVRASGKKAMCGFNYRFIPAVRLAKQLLENGTMGRVYNFNGVYNQDVGAYEDTPYEKLWYASGGKSSGVALGIGSHLLDLSRFLVGEITAVAGRTVNYMPVRNSQSGPKEVGQEEEMLAILDFAGGATGLVKASAVSAGRKNQLAFEIACSKGSIRFDMQDINSLHVFLRDTPVAAVSGFTKVDVTQLDKGHPFMDVWWPRGHGVGWEHAHINELAHFLTCVAGDIPLQPYGATFEDGYRAIRVVEAIKESQLSGRRIALEKL